jgi:hypothetical protein
MKQLNCLVSLTILIAMLPLAAISQVVFPVKISANKHYLIDQRDNPFPILGRTSWCVISLSESDYKKYIENTVLHGFNAIEMSVICHWPQSNYPPYNGRGDLPFLKRLNGYDWNGALVYGDMKSEAPDLTTPNEKYWNYVDTFLAYCESKGILVFIFPAYLGYSGTKEGWMKELLANDAEKTMAYGKWVANRYKNQKNLVWMLIGDMGKFTPEEKKVEAALIKGLKSVPDQQSSHYSAEPGGGSNSVDQPDFGTEMTLNGVYTWGTVPIATLGRKAFSRVPEMPAFLLEEPYDEEGPDGNRFNPHAIQPVRRFQWWGWLTSIGGYIAGNGYIWPFIDGWWERHLNTPATLDNERLNAFIKSIRWWKLVPSDISGMKNLITAGGSTDDKPDYVAAAASLDGSLLIAYIPPDHKGTITVDLTVLKNKISASWFDPTKGNYITVTGPPLNNKATRQFTPPGKNSQGQNDWVLKITASDL